MRIVEQGIVVRGREGTEASSTTFPGVCVLPNIDGRPDRWLCSYRAAPSKASVVAQRVLLTWSDDEGRSWRDPFEPFHPPECEGKRGALRAAYLTCVGERNLLATICWVDASNPSRPFFNPKSEGILSTRIFLSRSDDRGENWSLPARLDTNPITMETPITGPTLALADGEWACQFELNKAYDDMSVWRHSSVLMISRDRGKSWPLFSVSANDPDNRLFYWDQRPGVLVDDRILDLFWTYDCRAAAYLTIHARQSEDHGRTWSPLWDTAVPGQPAAPVQLPDGRIAMVYVDRTTAPLIKIRTSADGGRTWPAETEDLLYRGGGTPTERKSSMPDAWSEMGKFSVGLPSTAHLAGGDVLVALYAGPKTDVTDIRWIRVRAD